MHPRKRIDFSTPFDRSPLRWDEHTHLLIWPVVNVEEWDINQPMPRHASPPPGGISKAVPDMPNWSWHEYGMRVGFWRILNAFKQRQLRATLSINAKVCETCPAVPQAAKESLWEFMAHCYVQMSIHNIQDQPSMIKQSLEVLENFLGYRPRGWLGPGRTQTFETLDYLAEAGIDWFGDWILDDQPLWVRTQSRPLVSLPYTVEINDITIMLSGQHESDAMLVRAKDAFNRLYEEGKESVRIMAFGVHPYVTGAAHRIHYFEQMLDYFLKHKGVRFCTGDEIYQWFLSQQPAP